MPEIIVSIPGTPIAKKRPRFARKGKFVQTYSDQETEEGKWLSLFMASLDRATISDRPIIKKGIPVILSCNFVMPVISSMSKRTVREIEAGREILHVKKPDCDNCLKFVKDCLNSIAWADDSQVAKVEAKKFYGVEARTEITIRWE